MKPSDDLTLRNEEKEESNVAKDWKVNCFWFITGSGFRFILVCFFQFFFFLSFTQNNSWSIQSRSWILWCYIRKMEFRQNYQKQYASWYHQERQNSHQRNIVSPKWPKVDQEQIDQQKLHMNLMIYVLIVWTKIDLRYCYVLLLCIIVCKYSKWQGQSLRRLSHNIILVP